MIKYQRFCIIIFSFLIIQYICFLWFLWLRKLFSCVCFQFYSAYNLRMYSLCHSGIHPLAVILATKHTDINIMGSNHSVWYRPCKCICLNHIYVMRTSLRVFIFIIHFCIYYFAIFLISDIVFFQSCDGCTRGNTSFGLWGIIRDNITLMLYKGGYGWGHRNTLYYDIIFIIFLMGC